MDKSALNDRISTINLEYYEVLYFCIYRMKGEIMISKKTFTIIPLLCFFFSLSVAGLCAEPENLIPLLMDLEGWEADKAEVTDATFQNFRTINVSREYEKDDQTLSASIVIGYQSAVMWNPMYHEGFKMEAGDSIVEVKKTDGFFVFHSYQKPDKAGMCIVLLQETSQQKRTGAVFAFSYEGIEDSEGLELAKKFDWKKMSEIAREIKL